METTFKTFGTVASFPLPIDGDWVRIHCGVNGEPNYIFGLEGLKLFYESGAGIYSRGKNGEPEDSLEFWKTWYEREKYERIMVSSTIEEIKKLLVSQKHLITY